MSDTASQCDDAADEPLRVISCASIAALVLAALGLGLLPYVFIGMLGVVMLLPAAILAMRVALAGPQHEEASSSAVGFILLGLLLLAGATAELSFFIPSLVRPDDFEASMGAVFVSAICSLLGPTLIASGMRRMHGLDEARTTNLWLYWFSYVPVASVASFLISLVGWGTSA